MSYTLIERYKKFLNKDYKKLLEYRTKKFPLVVRIDNSYVPEEKTLKFLAAKNIKLEKIKYLKYGYKVVSKINITSTPEYLSGLLYIQSASSQIPVEVLDPRPKELILDMAASPGSKLTQIAQYSNNKGIVIGLEINKERMLSMHNNIERMKCKNIITYNIDALEFNTNLLFDKILLDAPCSGNLCLEKDWLEKRTIEDIRKKANYQKKLVEKAISLLKRGGILIYSTCSLEPEENEEIIESAITNLPLKLEKIDININTPRLINSKNKQIKEKTIRIWPHLHNTDAFFIAKLIKL